MLYYMKLEKQREEAVPGAASRGKITIFLRRNLPL